MSNKRSHRRRKIAKKMLRYNYMRYLEYIRDLPTYGVIMDLPYVK